jgi:hypothetical protein
MEKASASIGTQGTMHKSAKINGGSFKEIYFQQFLHIKTSNKV